MITELIVDSLIDFVDRIIEVNKLEVKKAQSYPKEYSNFKYGATYRKFSDEWVAHFSNQQLRFGKVGNYENINLNDPTILNRLETFLLSHKGKMAEIQKSYGTTLEV